MLKSTPISRAVLAVAFFFAAMSASAATLRVLTYNIHHGVGRDNSLNLSRIASVIADSGADIVSLQEVDNGVPRSNNVNQVARLAELTGMQWYFGKARDLNGGAYGNGVLVRQGIDIVSTQNFALPNPNNTEPRAVAQLGLSLDSNSSTAEFNFFATHFAHDSPAGRQQSAQYINSLVASSTVPSILAGDMNFNPGSTAFNITSNQWTDATNIANPGINRSNQIDYVFYRSTSQWNVATAGQFIRNSTTDVASDHYPLLAVLELPNVWPGSALVWNDNSGSTVAFTNGFATGNGNQGIDSSPASPWNAKFNNGRQNLMVGYNGNASLSGATSRTIGSMRIGTNQANSIISGRNGDGIVTTSGTMGLLVSSSIDSSGDLIVGEGGFSGTMNWNSSGTLEIQGRLRVGQSGTGTFNQSNGIVIAGNTAGSLRFIGIGVDPGSNGTYNLDGGILRPSGGFNGTQFRQTLVGDNNATGALNVGNDVGGANTAVLESNDDLIVGRGGGTGTVNVRSDGRIELRTSSNSAEFVIGENGIGTVTQTGGTVTSDSTVRIGGSVNGVGLYAISGGALTTATDGSGTFQIARSGATGTLRISGTASVSHGAELFIATEPNTGSTGRIEITGSQATVQIGQLDNATGGSNGMNETIRWVADANGITPIVISGTGTLTSNRVRLQSPAELAANTGSGSTLTGDGTALELDLSAITGSTSLTLINNLTTDSTHGFFEDGTTKNLFAEGATISGTGFNGTVNISYAGGDGNDVVLNLVAAAIPGDHNSDGVVDAADYVLWRKTGGHAQGYTDWRNNFGATNNSGTGSHTTQVPEPCTGVFILAALGIALAARLR